MNATPVVTRFAPSPTGQLHVGGARTALFAWAYARQQRGRFILRLEDTDQARSSADSTRAILRDLQWLGLEWDEGPDAAAADPMDLTTQRGPHGPYFQSQRLDLYQQAVDQLLASGAAYRPADSPEIVRLRMGQDVSFHDEVFGNITVPGSELEDFVIQKSDGFPTFHLAVVVDDALMGVTHVIRGQEHLSNTPKHVALQAALGYPRPVYVHMPSILNPDGSKMSKRDKAKLARQSAKQANLPAAALTSAGVDAAALTAFLNKDNDDLSIAHAIADKLGLTLPEINVADFRASGYLPDALLNYLSLLGWNPGQNIEKFDRAFLVERFSFDRLGKSNSKFDRAKLLSFNADALAALPPEVFAAQLQTHFQQRHPQFIAQLGERFPTFALAYQPRSKTLSDPAAQGAFFVCADDAIVYDEKAVKKVLARNDNEGFTLLRELGAELAQLDPFTGTAGHDLIGQLAQQRGNGMGAWAQPLRVALTGSTVSPPLDVTLDLLGRPRTLARIERCLTLAG